MITLDRTMWVPNTNSEKDMRNISNIGPDTGHGDPPPPPKDPKRAPAPAPEPTVPAA